MVFLKRKLIPEEMTSRRRCPLAPTTNLFNAFRVRPHPSFGGGARGRRPIESADPGHGGLGVWGGAGEDGLEQEVRG